MGKIGTSIIGFSGSRSGMSPHQRDRVIFYLGYYRELMEVHHGDCVGADAQFHELVRMYRPDVKIIIHPPDRAELRAFCDGDEVLKKRDYLKRNKDIVLASQVLITTPAISGPSRGTKFTIDYARKLDYYVHEIGI